MLPQLLSSLNADTLDDSGFDFATLLIYTCTDSCDIGNKYQSEYIVRQRYSEKQPTNI